MGNFSSSQLVSQEFLNKIQKVQSLECQQFGKFDLYQLRQKPYDYYLQYTQMFIEKSEMLQKKLKFYQSLPSNKHLVPAQYVTSSTKKQMCAAFDKLSVFCIYYNFTLQDTIKLKIKQKVQFQNAQIHYILKSLIQVGKFYQEQLKSQVYSGFFKTKNIFISPQGHLKIYPFNSNIFNAYLLSLQKPRQSVNSDIQFGDKISSMYLQQPKKFQSQTRDQSTIYRSGLNISKDNFKRLKLLTTLKKQYSTPQSHINPMQFNINSSRSQINQNKSQVNPSKSQVNQNLSQINPSQSQIHQNKSQINHSKSYINGGQSQINKLNENELLNLKGIQSQHISRKPSNSLLFNQESIQNFSLFKKLQQRIINKKDMFQLGLLIMQLVLLNDQSFYYMKQSIQQQSNYYNNNNNHQNHQNHNHNIHNHNIHNHNHNDTNHNNSNHNNNHHLNHNNSHTFSKIDLLQNDKGDKPNLDLINFSLTHLMPKRNVSSFIIRLVQKLVSIKQQDYFTYDQMYSSIQREIAISDKSRYCLRFELNTQDEQKDSKFSSIIKNKYQKNNRNNQQTNNINRQLANYQNNQSKNNKNNQQTNNKNRQSANNKNTLRLQLMNINHQNTNPSIQDLKTNLQFENSKISLQLKKIQYKSQLMNQQKKNSQQKNKQKSSQLKRQDSNSKSSGKKLQDLLTYNNLSRSVIIQEDSNRQILNNLKKFRKLIPNKIRSISTMLPKNQIQK